MSASENQKKESIQLEDLKAEAKELTEKELREVAGGQGMSNNNGVRARPAKLL